MSLNFVACAQKKDSKTRLTKGSGRESGMATQQEMNGWNTLNAYSEETELSTDNNNPDAAARAFINNDPVFLGPSQVNSISMRLVFLNNGQFDAQKSMMGLRFYDSNDPLVYFLGKGNGRTATSGVINGNRVTVTFADMNEDGASLGNVVIDGVISGQRFTGKVIYGDGTVLGNFNVTRDYAIFKN